MTDPAEIARVAAGLTRAQREEMRHGKFPASSAELREHRTRKVLVRLKLATFHHIIAGRGDYKLTERGLAVRAHILREKSGG